MGIFIYMKNHFNPYELNNFMAKLAVDTIPSSNYQAQTSSANLASFLQGMFYSIQSEFELMQGEINSLKKEIEDLKKKNEPNPHLDVELE